MEAIVGDLTSRGYGAVLWEPDNKTVRDARVTRFMTWLAGRGTLDSGSYQDLWHWSVTDPAAFWSAVWDYFGVLGDRGDGPVLDGQVMPYVQWFGGATLNYARNALRTAWTDPDRTAIIFDSERGRAGSLSYGDLAQQVARVARGLAGLGVGSGDRVAALLPNVPEAVVGLLAAASLGAIWSSCSPDFGAQGILDRFGQIEPKVLIAVDGYHYNAKAIDIREKVAEVAAKLPGVAQVVVVPYLHANPDVSAIDKGVTWPDFVAAFDARLPEFKRLPFNQPLYILYSSGTTGVPKCIVHTAGGVLVQHLKEEGLHCDVQEGDRLFYFTTCGWMMWNWLASGLACGATLLLYDGSPFLHGGKILWELAAAERMTHFGTSAKYIDAQKKIELKPMELFDLSSVRTIMSTGSPLAPESFDYVYASVKKDVCLSSMSGGTDLCASFVGGSPTLPVWRGEIQCKLLGMSVEAFDDDGNPFPEGGGQRGELVCTRPFPSMPIGFWNDPGDEKYRAAYYERFPGVWCHGDYIEITAHGGTIIYGRSDAVLNPGGVRIGTAEIYRQVEQLDEVVESLVIGQDWDNDVRVVLFVRLRDGMTLDGALIDKIKKHIRTNTTPRHVPAKVLQVADIPRTKSNKIVELAVRHVVHGRPVKNVEALANPEALEHYRDRPELQT